MSDLAFFDIEGGAVLYADGDLVVAGEFADVARDALARAGVEISEDPGFLLGRTLEPGDDIAQVAAKSLSDVDEYVEKVARIAELRARAAALEAEADALEAGAGDE